MAKVLQSWEIEFDRDFLCKVQLDQCIRGKRNWCDMTEIVSISPFCRPQNSFALSGQNGRVGTGAPMKEIIEEAITKYLEIIEKQKKSKMVRKRKEIIYDEKRRKRGGKGSQAKADK